MKFKHIFLFCTILLVVTMGVWFILAGGIPTVLTYPVPNKVLINDSVNCSFKIIEQPSDGTFWVNISWNNGTKKLNNSFYDYPNITIGTLYNNSNGALPRVLIERGENWTCEVAMFNQTSWFGTNSSVITYNAPTAGTPTLNESDVEISKPQFTCLNNTYFGVGSTTFFYKWFNESNVIPNNVTQNLTNESYRHFYLIKCETTPFDGVNNGTAVNTTVLNITNSLPKILSANLYPVIINKTVNASVNYSFNDQDEDVNLSSVKWFVNGVYAGVTNNTVLASTNYSKGNNLSAEITPFDGYEYNPDNFKNASVLVQNSKPSTTIPVLNQTSVFKSTAQITCINGSFVDADSDTPSFAYKWFNDSKVIPNNTTQNLTNQSYNHFDLIKCEVTPSDGDASGVGINSTVLNISNSLPALTLLLNNSRKVSTNVSVNATVYDADSDPVFLAFYINETTTINSLYQNLTNNGSTFLGKNDTRFHWRVVAFDSYNNSESAANFTFFINLLDPVINVTLPLNNSFVENTTLIQLNLTFLDTNGFNCSYNITNHSNIQVANGTFNCMNTTNITLSLNTIANYTINFWANDTFNIINTSSFFFKTNNYFPTLNLTIPAVNGSYGATSLNGSTLGYSVPLEFSANDSDRDKCWYNVTTNANVLKIGNTIINCNESASMYFAGQGSFVVYLYANDTFNYITTTNAEFTVQSYGTTSGGGGSVELSTNCYANESCTVYFGNKYYCGSERTCVLKPVLNITNQPIPASQTNSTDSTSKPPLQLPKDTWWFVGIIGGVLVLYYIFERRP